MEKWLDKLLSKKMPEFKTIKGEHDNRSDQEVHYHFIFLSKEEDNEFEYHGTWWDKDKKVKLKEWIENKLNKKIM